jgi:hypothetical protein
LRGDLAHRVTESGIVRPERFSHTLACFCVCQALFGRHGHDRTPFGRSIENAVYTHFGGADKFGAEPWKLTSNFMGLTIN